MNQEQESAQQEQEPAQQQQVSIEQEPAIPTQKKKKAEPKTKAIKKKKTPVAVTKKLSSPAEQVSVQPGEEIKQEQKSPPVKQGAVVSPKITLKTMNTSIDGRIKKYISKVIRWNMLSLPQVQLTNASSMRQNEQRFDGGPIKMDGTGQNEKVLEQVDTGAPMENDQQTA